MRCLAISALRLIDRKKGQNAPDESTIFREGAWERFGVRRLAYCLSRLINQKIGQKAPHRPSLFSKVARCEILTAECAFSTDGDRILCASVSTNRILCVNPSMLPLIPAYTHRSKVSAKSIQALRFIFVGVQGSDS